MACRASNSGPIAPTATSGGSRAMPRLGRGRSCRMRELRFHGRGGQGTVVASKLLAVALFLEGREVQSFPMFGVERRGAPVTAFVVRADPRTDWLHRLEREGVEVKRIEQAEDLEAL